MPHSLPLSVNNGQPPSVSRAIYRFRMTTKKKTESAVKAVLRENVIALIAYRDGVPPGQVGVTRLKALGFANGTAQRLLGREQDVNFEALQTLADGLGLEPWQLLVPGIDPAATPTLTGDTKPWAFPMVDEERYLALTPDARNFVQGKLASSIEEQELRAASRQPRLGNGR